MKKNSIFIGLLLFGLIGSHLLWAQPRRGLNQADITKAYDPTTEVVLEGKIIEVWTENSGYGRFPGLLMKVKDKAEETRVFLAPVWYLEQEAIRFDKQQMIKIIGSKTVYQNDKIIISRQFDYQTKSVTVRDNKGVPVWAGKRIGPGQGRQARTK